jgi:predicted nucleic-acid-binding protein
LAAFTDLPILQKSPVKKVHGNRLFLINMQKVDANIVLRYILNDHEVFSPQAKEIIDKNVVEVPVEVLCEVIYVLTGYYKIDRQNVSTKLKRFFVGTQCILPHQEVILQAIEYFGKDTLDFVDCILAGYAKVEKDKIYTFDERLQRLIEKIK